MKTIKNPIRCWECRKKNQDCYCDLDSKKSLEEINKVLINERFENVKCT